MYITTHYTSLCLHVVLIVVVGDVDIGRDGARLILDIMALHVEAESPLRDRRSHTHGFTAIIIST